ncbi:MAG: ThuA domain-containing protein, partial [Cyclobacteriaceae bacterium]|nr:ThuA domain-containing protein [Cyclobacteriaceae bacterium]
WTDEWYEFSEEKVNDLNYLITLDGSSYDPSTTWKNRDTDEKGNKVDRVAEKMKIRPISWYHEFDGGRSFYTALGHIEKVYENQWFLDHLYGGIYYAATGKGIQGK